MKWNGQRIAGTAMIVAGGGLILSMYLWCWGVNVPWLSGDRAFADAMMAGVLCAIGALVREAA